MNAARFVYVADGSSVDQLTRCGRRVGIYFESSPCRARRLAARLNRLERKEARKARGRS